MYKIKIDDVLVYDLLASSSDLKLLTPKLSIEDSEPGSLTFIVPLTHRYYSQFKMEDDSIFKRLISIVEVYKNDKWLWAGRIVDDVIENDGRISITCEGVLGFLKDIKFSQGYIHPDGNQPAYGETDGEYFFDALLNCYRYELYDPTTHQHRTGTEKKDIYFKKELTHIRYAENLDVDADPFIREEANYSGWNKKKKPIVATFKSPYDLLEEINSYNDVRRFHYKIVKQNGAFYLSIFSTCSLKYDQNVKSVIRYGENLLDVSISRSPGDVYTVPVPKGPQIPDAYFEDWGGQFANGYPFNQDGGMYWTIIPMAPDGSGTFTGYISINSPININGKDYYHYLRPSDYQEIGTDISYRRANCFVEILRKYGWIEKVIEIPALSTHQANPWEILKRDAMNKFGEYLDDYYAFDGIFPVEFKISAYDLADLGVKNVDHLELFDLVEVNSSRLHNLYNKQVNIMAIEFELDKINAIEFTFSETGNWRKPMISRDTVRRKL